MKLSEKINYACERGYHVKVRWENEWCIISPYKDGYGTFRHSGWWISLALAETEIGGGMQKINWEHGETYGATYEGIYKPDFKLYEVGEKVMYNNRMLSVASVDKDRAIYSLTNDTTLPQYCTVAYSGVPYYLLEPYFEEELEGGEIYGPHEAADVMHETKTPESKLGKIVDKALEAMPDEPMQKWEYTRRIQMSEDSLNRLGADCWELAVAIRPPGVNDVHYIFKRPLKD